MLLEISIKNFAIIEEISLNFEKGMTVLTGETGAGKSIIIDAMNMMLGSRATTDFIRHGAPKAEIEGDMGDSHVGLQARLMSQAMRKLTGIISKSRTTAIFINQIREKVGVMFGNPETTTGGRALKFYASIRLDVRKIDTIKQGNDPVGSRTRIKVVKNKVWRKNAA